MDFGTQESRGPGLNKRMWSIDEDRKLIGALLDLQNEGKYKAESGFKPGLFNAVEKRLAETLPNSGLKADPHIKSRIKTLKAHFGVVHDMIYGSHISGFGFDDTKMCVVAEKEVWDTYLQSHKKAAYFRDKPFPLYKELCTIFGKDRAIGKDSETPADALEELNKENAQIGHDYEVNDGLDSMSFTQSATIGNTSGESSRKKRKVRSQSDENMIYEIMEKSTMIISSTMEATANRLSLALEDATVTDLKLQLNKELMKLQGLSMIERHKATIKIGCDRDLTQIFFTIDDEEKEAWVKVILS